MSIGSTIKKLRRESDMTQEELAEYLGITSNAVSQWECNKTSPDISQLPILANIFEVTTDYLLGIDVSDKQSVIEGIHNEAWSFCNAGDKTKAAEIVRTGLINYPNSFKLMFDLVVFLYQRAFHQECSKDEQRSFCIEAAGYIDKIIEKCTDMQIQCESVELACIIFPTIGRYDDAVGLVSAFPDTSKDEILTALYSGNKLTRHIKKVICKSVSTAADQTLWLASANDDDGNPLFDENSKIILYKKVISFYKTLYENGDFFFDAECLAEAEKNIANILASKKDREGTLYHLSESIKYTVLFDTYDENKDVYSSMIPFGKSPVGINRNNKWNNSHEMIVRLNGDARYDFIRENDEFKNLIQRLTQTDNVK
ncbi:MAG: helix-turn-helix transcriptional regulator [Clostridia bacterium]|nr:helix-turn-helix transcriptional regulator [Clostridia bacterium]